MESVLIESADAVTTLTVNRPDKLNALNAEVLTGLRNAVDKLPTSCRAVILTGAGKAFVAGADIAAMQEMSPTEAKGFSDLGHELGRAMERCPVPLVAAVNGFALGGGCELALCCDFIYASEKAKFGQPEVKLGLMPGFGGTNRLARRVGLGQARELVYTGAMIKADEALRIGLVNKVFGPDDLLAEAQKTAEAIAGNAPLGIASCKRVFERGYDADLVTANELEATAFASLFGSQDQREGTSAFLEKRSPIFKGS